MMFFHSFGSGVEMKGGGGGAAVVDDYDDNQQQRTGGFLVTKQQLQHQHYQALQQQQQQKPECYSDEVDSRSGDGGAADSCQRHPKRQRKSSTRAAAVAAPPPPSAKAASGGGVGEDEATVEVGRRPRGRPPGSKNKPKPPVVITRDADDTSPAAMRPYVLEVPPGRDVVDALSRFSHRRNLGLCVLAGNGLVSNVVLRHPSSSPSPTRSADLSFPGHFQILSISATFLPPSFASSPPSALPEFGGGVSITLAGPHAHVFGGLVGGPLTAAGTVTVLAAAFCNPTYHRLPAEDEVSVSVSVSVSGGEGDTDVAAARTHAPQAPRHERRLHNTPSHHHQQQQQPQQQQQQHPHRQQQQRSTSPPSSSAAAAAAQHHHHHPAAALAAPTAAEVRGMSIYSCHLPSDAIWAPAGRSPPY